MKRKNNFDKFFLLSWRKIFIGIAVGVLVVVLHNLTYAFIVGILKIEIVDEPFFFIIAIIVIPIYFLISIIYSIIRYIQKNR